MNPHRRDTRDRRNIMGYEFMDGFSGMGFGVLVMVFWVALFIALIVLAVRWLGGTPAHNGGLEAQNALRERFARGEIDVDEFEKRSRTLRKST